MRPTFSASNTSSQRINGPMPSLKLMISTLTTTCSRLLPSSPPSALRPISKIRQSMRHARGSLPPSLPTGLKSQEREHRKKENYGHRAFTMFRICAAMTTMSGLANTDKVDGKMMPGPINPKSSTTAVDPSNSSGTTTTVGSQMSSPQAPTTASSTSLRTLS